MIFILSSVKDEYTKIENLAGTGKPGLKSDSAIIRRCPWCRNSASLIALKLICASVNPESVQDFDVLTVLTLRIDASERPTHCCPLPPNMLAKPRDTGGRLWGASNEHGETLVPGRLLWSLFGVQRRIRRKMQNSHRDRILTDRVTINAVRLEDVLPTQARIRKTDTSLEEIQILPI